VGLTGRARSRAGRGDACVSRAPSAKVATKTDAEGDVSSDEPGHSWR
jgi:hypothetical protein